MFLVNGSFRVRQLGNALYKMVGPWTRFSQSTRIPPDPKRDSPEFLFFLPSVPHCSATLLFSIQRIRGKTQYALIDSAKKDSSKPSNTTLSPKKCWWVILEQGNVSQPLENIKHLISEKSEKKKSDKNCTRKKKMWKKWKNSDQNCTWKKKV